MRRLLVVLILSLACASPAQAAWFAGQPVDSGASAFGGLDVARDGGAAVTYVKGGHVWLSRMVLGAWQRPEDLGDGSDPVVADAEGGALIVAWRSADRVLGAYSDGGPMSAASVLGSGDVSPPRVDMAIQRTAYVTFRQAGDVRVVRLKKGAWEAAPAPMDIDPAADASNPQVVASADGNALIVWQESGALWARRLTYLQPSTVPQQIATGADQVDVEAQDDPSFAWVTYRQGGRVYARLLRGSAFDPAVGIDLGGPSGAPSVSTNGDGVGLAATQSDAGDIGVSLIDKDEFGPAVKVGSGTAPLVAGAESRDLVVTWQTSGGFVGRHGPRDKPLQAQTPLGAGAGPAGIGIDRKGDAALGWLQGDAIVAAVWDEPPGAASLRTSRALQETARPLLRWTAGLDLWGAQTFRVLIDGKQVGTTTKQSLRPKVADGAHKWRVVSVDTRGQRTAAKKRDLRIDGNPPVVRVRTLPGRRLLVTVSDRGSGVASAHTNFGDGTGSTAHPPPVHRYRKAGSYRVTVRAVDGRGHAGTTRLPVRIR